MAEERKSISESLKALSKHRYTPTEERLKSVYQAPTDEPPPMEQPAKYEAEPPVEVAPPVVPSIEKKEEEEVPYLLKEKTPGIIPGIGGKGFWAVPERGPIGDIGVPVDVRVSTKAQRDVYRNLDKDLDPMETAELIAAGTIPHDPGRPTPREYKDAHDPSWYETIFHWLEPFDWPRRYASMAGYGAASLLPDPTEPGEEETFTSSLGDTAQKYVGRYMREQYFKATESPSGFLKSATFGTVLAPLSPIQGFTGEEESPYDQIGESLYKAFATGELYETGKMRRGMVYADGEGGGIPFVDLIGEEGFTTPLPMGEDLLDASIPKHLAMELAEKTNSPVNKMLFDILSSDLGRVVLGISIEVAADPLWFAGPAAGSKTVTIPGKVVTLNRNMVRTAGSVARITGDDVHRVERMLATKLVGEAGSIASKAEIKAIDDYLEVAQKMAQEGIDDLIGNAGIIGTIASRRKALKDPVKAIEAARKEAEIAKNTAQKLIDEWGKAENVTSKMVESANKSAIRLQGELDMLARGAATATPETATKYLKSKLRFDERAAKVFKRDIDMIASSRAMIADGLASGTFKEAGRFSVHVPFGKDTYYLSNGAKRIGQTVLPEPLVKVVSTTVDWAKEPRIQDLLKEVGMVGGKIDKTSEGWTNLSGAGKFALSSWATTGKVAAAPMVMYQLLANAFGTRYFQPLVSTMKTKAQMSTIGVGGVGNMFARVPIFGDKFIALKRVSPHVWSQYQESVTNYMRKVVSLESNLLQWNERIVRQAKTVSEVRKIEAKKGMQAAIDEETRASDAINRLTSASTETEKSQALDFQRKARENLDNLKNWQSDQYGPMNVIMESANAMESGAAYLKAHPELEKITSVVEAFVQDFALKSEKELEEVRVALMSMARSFEGDISKTRHLSAQIEDTKKGLEAIPEWKKQHRQAVQSLALENSARTASFKKMLNAIGTGDAAVDKLARALEKAKAVLNGQPYDEVLHAGFIRDELMDVLKNEELVNQVLSGAARNIGIVDDPSRAVVVLADRLSGTLAEGQESVGRIITKNIKSLEERYVQDSDMLRKALAGEMDEAETYEALAKLVGEDFQINLASSKSLVGDVLWDDFVKFIDENPDTKGLKWSEAFFNTLPLEKRREAGLLPKVPPRAPEKPKKVVKSDLPADSYPAINDWIFQYHEKVYQKGDVFDYMILDERIFTSKVTPSKEKSVINSAVDRALKIRKNEDVQSVIKNAPEDRVILYRARTKDAPKLPEGQKGLILTKTPSLAENAGRYPRWKEGGAKDRSSVVIDEFAIKPEEILAYGGDLDGDYYLVKASELEGRKVNKVPDLEDLLKKQKEDALIAKSLAKDAADARDKVGDVVQALEGTVREGKYVLWPETLEKARKQYMTAHALGMAAKEKYVKALSLLEDAPLRAGVFTPPKSSWKIKTAAKASEKLANHLGMSPSRFGRFTRGNLIRERLNSIFKRSKNDAEFKENLTEAVKDIFLADVRALASGPDPILDELVGVYSSRLADQISEEGIEFLYRGEPIGVRTPKADVEEFVGKRVVAGLPPKEPTKPFEALTPPSLTKKGVGRTLEDVDLVTARDPLLDVTKGPALRRVVETPEDAIRRSKKEAINLLKSQADSISQRLKFESEFAGKQLEDLQKAHKKKLAELEKLREEVQPKITVPTRADREAGKRVLKEWEQNLWLEFKSLPQVQKLTEEDLTYAAYLAMRGMPDLPDKTADYYEDLVKNYGIVSGKRFGDYDEALDPVIEEFRSLIKGYEKLYEEHGMDFMKKPGEMLIDWGVVEYVPHIANNHDLVALGKADAKSALTAREFGGVDSLDSRLSTSFDAKKKRTIDGTIKEINAMGTSPTLALDPMSLVARYMQANRAMTAQEMMYSLLKGGVMRVVKSEPGVPAHVKAAQEDLVPLFQRPSVKRDIDLLLNGSSEELEAIGLSKGSDEAIQIANRINEWVEGIRDSKRYSDISPFATWIRESPLLQQSVNVHDAITSVRMKQVHLGRADLFNAKQRFGQIKSGVASDAQKSRINKAVEKATRSAKRKTSSWEERDQALLFIQEQAAKGRDRAIWDEVASELHTVAASETIEIPIKRVSGSMLSTYFAEGQEIWKLHVPGVIAQSMQDLFELKKIGTGTLGKKVLDKINAFWKTRLTIISTAFTARNIISNYMTNILDLGPFGALNPVTNFNASRLSMALQYSERYGTLKAARKAIYAPKQAHESTIDYALRLRSQQMFRSASSLIDTGIDLGDGLVRDVDEAIKILKDNGVASGAYTQFVDIDRAEQGISELMINAGKSDWSSKAKNLMSRAEDVVITTIPLAMTGTLVPITLTKKFGAEVARVAENQARISNFIGNMRRSGNIKEAANHANKFLFNYNDLTALQKTWMRTIFPFFTWNNKNIHLQLEMMQKSPALYSQFSRLMIFGLPRVVDAADNENYVRTKPGVTKDELKIRMPHTLSMVRVPMPRALGKIPVLSKAFELDKMPKEAYIEGLGLPIEPFVEMMSIIGSTVDYKKTYDQFFGAGQELGKRSLFKPLAHAHFAGRLGLELATGQHTYYDKPIKELTNGRLIAQSLTSIGRFNPELAAMAANVLGLMPAQEVNFNGEIGTPVYVSGGVNHLFMNMPYSRFLRDASSLVDAYRVSLAQSNRDVSLEEFEKIPYIARLIDALTGVRLVQVKEGMERRMYESKLLDAQLEQHESRGYSRSRISTELNK
tara:strand:+ start:14080 stop:22206 length:8127 start_codon:yes stop_codon:yes gene_type:complete